MKCRMGPSNLFCLNLSMILYPILLNKKYLPRTVYCPKIAIDEFSRTKIFFNLVALLHCSRKNLNRADCYCFDGEWKIFMRLNIEENFLPDIRPSLSPHDLETGWVFQTWHYFSAIPFTLKIIARVILETYC